MANSSYEKSDKKNGNMFSSDRLPHHQRNTSYIDADVEQICGPTDPSSIRKYLVLLQDCLAIKFVPLTSSSLSTNNGNSNNNNRDSNSHSLPLVHTCQFKCNCKNTHKNSGSSCRGNANSNGEEDHQQCQNNQHVNNKSQKPSHNPNLDSNTFSRHQRQHQEEYGGVVNQQMTSNSGQAIQNKQHYPTASSHTGSVSRTSHLNFNRQTTAKVDHSLHGLFLYKEFREVNLQCFWNTALHETFRNLEYKGYVVPSTILVSAFSRYLTVLKTAWSRKMLPSAPGYRIEFVGEIEELIADPIQKSHFVPLSDSLCWAIHEITSSGRQAFVDAVLTELADACPTMVRPSRELVYQTLEKLTREKKVYQTAQGYFVVTPDTYRYIMSCDFSNSDPTDTFSPNTIARNLFVAPERVNFSLQHPNDTQDDTKTCKDNNEDEICPFGRSSSLKMFPKKELGNTKAAKSRSVSLRMPKSKVKTMNKCSETDGETLSKLSKDMKNLMGSGDFNSSRMLTKKRKSGSFLSKLLIFRRSSKVGKKLKTKSSKLQKTKSCYLTETCTMSTQTSFSIEALNVILPSVADIKQHNASNSNSAADDSDSGRYTESSSDAEITAALAGSPMSLDWGSPMVIKKGSQNMGNILKLQPAEEEIYEKLKSYPSSTSSFHRGASSRSSTSSIDFTHTNTDGKMSGVDCDQLNSKREGNYRSPSPSSSASMTERSGSSLSSYRDLYNYYRRRHPSYRNQGLNGFKKPPASTPLTTTPSVIKSRPPHEIRHSFSRTTPDRNIFSHSVLTPKEENQHQSQTPTSSSTNTNITTVTQSVKSTSNVELELLLPLEKLISAALEAQRQKKSGLQQENESLHSDTRNNNNSTFEAANNICNSNNNSNSAIRSEFVTNVNDLFSIKSHVSISPNDALQSTIEIKTRNPTAFESVSVKPMDREEHCRESEII